MSSIPKLAIPNLFLKWVAFKEIVGFYKPDREVAEELFGVGGKERKTERFVEGGTKRKVGGDTITKADPGITFSRLLHGDRGCPAEIADALIEVINRRLREYGKVKSSTVQPPLFASTDLNLPVYEFIRRLVDAAQPVDAATLDRAHKALLDEMVVKPSPRKGDPTLIVEKYSGSLGFGRFISKGAPTFKAGQDEGRLVIDQASRPPLAAYTLQTCDPSPEGLHLWDLDWGEAVRWLPSPSKPSWSGGKLLLWDEPEKVDPPPGRYIVTSVLAWSEKAVAALDPRGQSAPPDALDEAETSRFITNLRRMTEDKHGKWEGALTVASAEYFVIL